MIYLITVYDPFHYNSTGNICWPVCNGGETFDSALSSCMLKCPLIHIMQGFLDIRWAKWKRVLFTRSVSIVPVVIIAASATNYLNYLEDYLNIEQSLLVYAIIDGFWLLYS